MQPLSSDLREFIHLLNTNSVKYVIVAAGQSHSLRDRSYFDVERLEVFGLRRFE